jgi:hypothetical protein
MSLLTPSRALGIVAALVVLLAATLVACSGDGPGATAAAAKPAVFLKLDHSRVSTDQRAKVLVVVRPGMAGAFGASAEEQRGAKVLVTVNGPGKTRSLKLRLSGMKGSARLPRLAAGTYKVRATFLGGPSAKKASSPTRTLTVVGDDQVRHTGWPGPDDTGVPPGTKLTSYSGPCTITKAGTVIDKKSVSCSELLVQAADVEIKRSQLKRIVVDTDVDRSWSLTLSDSEVDGGDGDASAISNGNVSILRSDIQGGHNGLECQEHSSFCELRDSWIHDQWQPPSGDAHLGGMLVMGTQVPCTGTGGVCVEVVHNTIVCDAPVNSDDGGCTGDLNLLPQWGPLPGALVTDNLFGANTGASYCTYGGAGQQYPATGIVYRGNVFERGTNRKCGGYGPVTSFDSSAPGNVWSDNTWDDGSVVKPSR